MSRADALPTNSAAMPGQGLVGAPPGGLVFEQVYEDYFEFVWRSVRRLGVLDASVDDVVQEVFLVVHRKLGVFEGRAALKSWLFGVVLRVVGHHRRTQRRKETSPRGETPVDPDSVADAALLGPHERASQAEAVRLLYLLLDELDDAKRAVFVMAELEEMSVPEIVEATGENLNTVYSRLRAARGEFDKALARHRAREARRQP